VNAQRIVKERVQQFCQQTEGLLDLRPVSASYGLFIPSYVPALLEHHKSYKLAGQPASLLLGAQSQDSVYEYAATVHAIYPDARCMVVDIEGQDLMNISPVAALCMLGNALSLDISGSTVDSIHSSFLLNHLKTTGGVVME